MKISAIQNVSNRNTKPLFKAGVTDFFSDFDGTFMPHKYRHDVFCNNSPSSPRKEFLESGKKDFQEYFDSFGEFLDTLRGKESKKLSFTITSGRNRPEFNYYLQRIRQDGLSIPIPDQLEIRNGGEIYNVIPDSVKIKGTSRAVDFEKRNSLYNEIKRLTKEVCKEYGAEGKLDFRFMYPPLVNNEEAVCYMREATKDVGMEVLELKAPFMGGEDFSYFAERYPSAYVYVGCRNEEKECIYPWHNSRFNMDEKCLTNGAKLLCAAVINVFEKQ